MRRLWQNTFLRGMVLIALVSLVIVLLSLEESLVTAGALLQIAFFLAIAFFLFLLWRERRSDIEMWSTLSQRTFYGAIVIAVVDVGAVLGLRPTRSGRRRVLRRPRLLRLGDLPRLAPRAPLRVTRSRETLGVCRCDRDSGRLQGCARRRRGQRRDSAPADPASRGSSARRRRVRACRLVRW